MADPFSDSFIHKKHYKHTQDLFALVNSISTKHFRRIHTHLRDAKQPVSNHTLIPHYGITIGDLFLYTFFDKIKKADHSDVDGVAVKKPVKVAKPAKIPKPAKVPKPAKAPKPPKVAKVAKPRKTKKQKLDDASAETPKVENADSLTK
jgi:hypothetical protein